MKWRSKRLTAYRTIAGLLCAVICGPRLVGCGSKVGVNENRGIQQAGNVGSGNNIATSAPIASGNQIAASQAVETHQAERVSSPTTQEASASAGDRGVAASENVRGEGSKSGQSGAVNFNWAPVAVGAPVLGVIGAIVWLTWSDRKDKRDTDARLQGERINADADKTLIRTAFGFGRQCLQLIAGGPIEQIESNDGAERPEEK